MRLNRIHYQAPKVFVSSTSGALLDEWRSSIRRFLVEEMRYTAWMWEDGQIFPYVETDPGRPVEDAIGAVSDCHIYILIIGPRYGTCRNERSHSITHEEFFVAKTANIPILAFVPKRIWNVVSHYEKNPEADFINFVDDKRVFDFILDLKQSNIIIQPFEIAQDIINELRGRFAKIAGALLQFSKEGYWVWCEEQTEDIESEANEVWVATPDLYWDVENPAFRRIVRRNVIDRKIPYKYIVIDIPENRNRFALMSRYYKHYGGKQTLDIVSVHWVSADEYPWPSEVAVYNPSSPLERRAVIVNPMEVTNRDIKYNIELGLNATMRQYLKMCKFFDIKPIY